MPFQERFSGTGGSSPFPETEPALHPLPQQKEQFPAQEGQGPVEQDLAGDEYPEDHPGGLPGLEIEKPANGPSDQRGTDDQDVTQDLDPEHGFFQGGIHQTFERPILRSLVPQRVFLIREWFFQICYGFFLICCGFFLIRKEFFLSCFAFSLVRVLIVQRFFGGQLPLP